MFLFAYLDKLPPVPQHLLDAQGLDEKQYYATPERVMADGTTIKNVDCQRWEVTPELEKWIQEHIAKSDQTGYQITKPLPGVSTHLVHTDSWPRRWVLNYIPDLGGDNVITNFYREKDHPISRGILVRPKRLDNLELLQSVKVQANRWCILNTSVLHEIINLTGPRVYVTIGIGLEDPFPAIHAYKDYLSL